MDLQAITQKALELGAAQKPAELFALLSFLAKNPPRSVVEIGTAKGGTLYALCQISSPDAILISVDLPGGKFGGGSTPEQRQNLCKYLRGKQEIFFILEDSHLAKVEKKVREIGREIDFLLIDGDHTYEGVKKDFEMYSPLVKKGGVIAFHDTLFHPFVPECRVDRFWGEIKDSFEHQEFIDKSNITWGGIGLIKYRGEKIQKQTVGDGNLLLQLGDGDLQKGFSRLNHDLEKFPWPVKDDSVQICIAPHVIEHIKPWLIFKFFDELWRIVKPSGQIALSTPYAGSMNWWSDPSHCTGFTERSFAYLDPQQEAYKIHKPKPWRIEKGQPTWKCNGNIECILFPVK